MSQLVRLSDIQSNFKSELGQDYYDPQGRTVYGASNEKIGRITDTLVEEATGKIRYFIVDVGGWFNSKEVLIPAGLAEFRGDEVYINSLTRDRAENLEAYDATRPYTYDDVKNQDQRVFNNEFADVNTREQHYNSPTTLELLEERLTVGKERFVAGTLQVAKRVVSNQQSINVTLEEEQAFINRHPVADRPADRAIGADAQTISVALEAERANVDKQAYVVEEVEIGKTAHQHQETITDTVKREELDVVKTGDVHPVENAAAPLNRDKNKSNV